jgi:ribonuclease D
MSSPTSSSTHSDLHSEQVRDAIGKAVSAAGTPIWIDEPGRLQQAAAEWQQHEWLAVDTEFIRERTFYARLGLLQVSDGNTVWLLDVPALSGHDRPIHDMLVSASINKIIHSCSEDLEVLSLQYQLQPVAVYDSQLAAAMTGRPLQMRYENLVQELLGEELPSGPSRSDWLQRPLSPPQLQYASNDVAYLPVVMRLLVAELQQRDRWQWLQEDMQTVLDKATATYDPDLLYRKVKGHMRCDQSKLARLQQLAAWRDQQARSRDLPRSFVLRDEGLLELAEMAVRSGTEQTDLQSAMDSLQLIPQRVIQRHQQDWLALFSAQPEQQPEVEAPLSKAEKDRLASMLAVIRAMAKTQGIDPALLASRRVLTELLLEQRRQAQQKVQLPGWRGSLLNAALQQP